jgi:hypothetical protein
VLFKKIPIEDVEFLPQVYFFCRDEQLSSCFGCVNDRNTIVDIVGA